MPPRDKERRQRAHTRATAREKRRIRQHSRNRIRRFFFGGIVGFVGLLIVLSLVLPSTLGSIGNRTTAPAEDTRVAIQEIEIVEKGQTHPDYSTTPPTSGWYYDVPLEDINWAPQDKPLEDEVQVSYLRRGGIMVQYNCPNECSELQQQLEQVVNRYPEGVILAPYPDMDFNIALTAWGWIDTLASFDDQRIDYFIQSHIDNGPESFR